jgi:hypothetical protein
LSWSLTVFASANPADQIHCQYDLRREGEEVVADQHMSGSSSVNVVAAAKRLAPLIRAARDEGEQIRRVPPRVVEALASSSLLQMFLPQSMGGPELAPLTVFRAIEEISKADGSIGWCAMIATDVSLFFGWLPAEVGREFCGQPADFRGAGSLRPLGRAYPVDGGYLSGVFGILPAASVTPTGSTARASLWTEKSRN